MSSLLRSVQNTASGTGSRSVPIDAFRGLCIVLMVLVNNPGAADAVYLPLQHVTWNGLAVADVVAPAFLWIVGFVIPVALSSHRKRETRSSELAWRIIRRCALLIMVGFLTSVAASLDFLLHGRASLQDVGLLDILQRIGLSYGFVALTYLRWRLVGVLTLGMVALLVYSVPMLWAIGSGGYAISFAKSSNFAASIDSVVLGPGLNAGQSLITLPGSILTTIAGLLTAVYTRQAIRPLLLAALGAVMCGVMLSPLLPVNRYLWTPSFVAVTAGISTLVFCLLSKAEQDSWFVRLSAPLVSFGRNPLLMYVLAALIAGWSASVGFSTGVSGWRSVWSYLDQLMQLVGLSAKAASHAVTLLLLALLWLLAWYLDRRRLYIRL